jgi:KUP system potassium uptake protein
MRGWYGLVFPCLVLNYLGQGAHLMVHPQHVHALFYSMVPSGLLIPAVIVATFATIIASQAIISGIFSLTWQAVMLRYVPKLKIKHTSEAFVGQVYAPQINFLVGALSIAVIVFFQTSATIAHAYGFCVAAMMMLTAVVLCVYIFKQQSRWTIVLLFFTGILVVINGFFVLSSLTKFLQGAWFAFVISAVITCVVYMWIQGNAYLMKNKIHNSKEKVLEYLHQHMKDDSATLPGVAVFFSRTPLMVPSAFIAHLRVNHLAHEVVVFLSLVTHHTPRIEHQQRYDCQEITKGIYQVTAHYGYKEVPDIQRIMHWLQERHVFSGQQQPYFFLSRRILVLTSKNTWRRLSGKLFRLLLKLAYNNGEFYHLPYHRVLDVGLYYKF